MQYLITPNPKTQEIRNLMKALGPESYTYLCLLIQEYLSIGSFVVDEDALKSYCGINAQKAKRILPFLLPAFLDSVQGLEESSQVFVKHLEKLKESSEKLRRNNEESLKKVERNFEETLKKVKTLGASNPRHSTRVKAKQSKQSKEISSSADDVDQLEKDFEQWWENYPRKVSKQEAKIAYLKARRLVDRDTLLTGLETYKRIKPAYADWTHGATWLNQRRWEDQPDGPEAEPVSPEQLKREALIVERNKLLAHSQVKMRFGRDVFDTADLVLDDLNPHQVRHGNNTYPVAMLEPVNAG